MSENLPAQEIEQLAPIKLWQFKNAPEELRALSDNGGDEDWLALVPKGAETPYSWPSESDIGRDSGILDSYDNTLGWGQVYKHGEDLVIIWSHA